MPAAPLQPCAGGPSERGHLFSGWVNLAPCNYFSNNEQACTGMGHPLGMVLCAEAPHPVGFYPVGGLYPSLPSTFPAHYHPLHGLMSSLHTITLTMVIKG